jgi:hypothetical protein
LSTTLDNALAELKLLPDDVQEAIAHDLLDMIRSERKWDQLFANPRSDALFERMAAEVRADIAAGRVIHADPSNSDGPNSGSP